MPPRKQSGCDVDALPRGNPNEGALLIWDPGGRPPGEGIIGEKGPVETNKSDCGQRHPPTKTNTARIVACNKKPPSHAEVGSEGGTTSNRQGHAPLPIHHRHVPSSRSQCVFVFGLRPMLRARRRPWRCNDMATGISTQLFGGRQTQHRAQHLLINLDLKVKTKSKTGKQSSERQCA